MTQNDKDKLEVMLFQYSVKVNWRESKLIWGITKSTEGDYVHILYAPIDSRAGSSMRDKTMLLEDGGDRIDLNIDELTDLTPIKEFLDKWIK